jgi:Variant SH3 domain/SH3 domain
VLARVLRPYAAQYPDPIEVTQGEAITLGKRDIDYPGWIWATSPASGKSGWIPEQFVQVNGDEARVNRDYSARELSVAEGDIVTIIEELLGWALVESPAGRGWVPATTLARSVSSADFPL